MKSKYKGIDSRDIKCCSDNENSIEAGISFDENDGVNILRFHFLDYEEGKILNQRTKSMHLNEENTNELIKKLTELTFNTSGAQNIISLDTAKELVAQKFGKNDWISVLRDYEYGLGISKLIGFKELMDKVAEVYKSNGTENVIF